MKLDRVLEEDQEDIEHAKAFWNTAIDGLEALYRDSGLPSRQALADLGFCQTVEGLDFLAWRRRQTFRCEQAFGLPCQEIVDLICALGPIVEVGAGTGFWGRSITSRGGTIRCTDAGLSPLELGKWYPVERLDGSDAVAGAPGTTVLMVWPSLNLPWSERVMDVMTPGTHLVYIGEIGGCTATETFERRLASSEFTLVSEDEMPRWPSMQDVCRVFVKARA